MCFQGFIYYACGHSQIVENECDLAIDQPFYIKVACPDYRSDNARPKQACGLGKYYCKQNNNGARLEHVYQNLDRAQAELDRIDQRLGKLKEVQTSFMRSADQAGVSLETRKKHPAFGNLVASQLRFRQQRESASQVRFQALKIIQDAINYYSKLNTQRREAGGSGFPAPMPPPTMASSIPAGTSFQPVALGVTPSLQHLPSNMSITGGTIDVSAYGRPPHERNMLLGQNTQQFPDPYNDYTTAGNGARFGPGEETSFYESRPPAPTSGRGRGLQAQHGNDQEATDESPRQVAAARKAREPREHSNVRRSDRVRGKKVKYAESEGSSIVSREPSPDKSDVSGFSPSKSDLSLSPAKSEQKGRRESRELGREADGLDGNELRRNRSSLSNLIGDWQSRSRVARGGTTSDESRVSQDKATRRGLPPEQGRLQREDNILPPNRTVSASSNEALPSLAAFMNLTRSRGLQTDPMMNNEQGMRHPDWPRPALENSFGGRPPARHGPIFSEPFGNTELPPPAPMPQILPSLPSQVSLPDMFKFHANNLMRRGAANPALPHTGGPVNFPSTHSNVDRSWLINTPAFQTQASHTAAPGPAAIGDTSDVIDTSHLPGERSDSVLDNIAKAGLYSKPNEPRPDLNYESLRRSFSATADLTPPTVVDLTSSTTEPKKRTVPASSPLPSSKKRMRLSLPGEDTTSSVYEGGLPYGQTSSLSSPSKMPSQQLPEIVEADRQPPAAAAEDTPVTQAPILAPTAVMYVPSWRDGAAEQDTSLPGQSGLEQVGAVEDASDEIGNLFSDIDWSLVNDDLMRSW